MTMKELAELANVSVSTVSKAFCDADDVSTDTKRLIFETAKKYGCYGKFYKGKYHKKIIAIICPEFDGGYYTSFVERLQNIIEENHGISIIATDNFDGEKQSELIEYFSSYLKVDGLFVFHIRKKLKKGCNIPIVSIFSSEDISVDEVKPDMVSPLYEAVEELYRLGHRKIAFIGEELTVGTSKTFNKIISENKNLTGVTIQSSLRFEKAGEDGVKQLLKKAPDCTAIICAYDYIAVGAMKQLKKSGFKVPEDYSITGIDNISFTDYTEVPLATIDSNPDEVCQKAWELMDKKLKNRYYRNIEPIIIRGEFIKKDTVTKPRGK